MAETVLEFMVHLAAWLVYGTDERPRLRILRQTVRTIAFTGSFVLFAALAGHVDLAGVPKAVYVVWAFCGLMVLSAEHELGSRRIAMAAYAAAATLLVGAFAWAT